MNPRLLLSALFCLFLTVLAGCGSSGSDILQPPVGVAPPPIVPPPPIPRPPIARVETYLLSADGGGGVGVYKVDPLTGVINEIAGSPFATANNLITLAVHPNGQLVYGGTDDTGFLEGFSLSPATGTLTPLPGSPIATVPDNNPFFDNSGEFLYVTGETTIDGFAVNATTGALTRLAGFPQAVPGLVEATTSSLSDDDTRLYLTDRGSNQIFVFSRNIETGALTQQSVVSSGATTPVGSGLTPDGRFLYVAHGDGTLVGFGVAGDGSLTQLPNPTVYSAAPALTYTLAFLNDLVYLGDGISRQMNAFRIGADGSLTQVAGFPRAGGGAGTLSYPFVFEAILYATDRANNRINAFTVNSNGSLNDVPGSPFTANGSPTKLAPAIVSF